MTGAPVPGPPATPGRQATPPRELVAHLALAMSRHVTAAREQGMQFPPELVPLAAWLVDCATTRQDATPLALGDRGGDGVRVVEPALLTKREAARALSCSVRTLERLVSAGELAAVKVEGATRVRRVDLDSYVAGLPARGSGFRDRVVAKSVPEQAAAADAPGTAASPAAKSPASVGRGGVEEGVA